MLKRCIKIKEEEVRKKDKKHIFFFINDKKTVKFINKSQIVSSWVL